MELVMEWIDRSDDLPEYGQNVILYDRMFDRYEIWHVDINPKELDSDYTHWMPLPEPPTAPSRGIQMEEG